MVLELDGETEFTDCCETDSACDAGTELGSASDDAGALEQDDKVKAKTRDRDANAIGFFMDSPH